MVRGKKKAIDVIEPPTPRQLEFKNFVEGLLAQGINGEEYRLQVRQYQETHGGLL